MSSFIAAAIPQELKEIRQWVCWKKEEREGQETKIPYEPSNRRAKPNDPATWTDFPTCMQAIGNGNGFNGVGFMFNHDYVGIDWDNCVDPLTGEITDPDVARMVDGFDSYTEYSQSRCGLHTIVKGRVPGSRRRNSNIVEMYDSGRFFCMTGDLFPGTPATIEPRQEVLDAFYRDVFGDDDMSDKGYSDVRATEHSAGLTDSEVIRKAAAAKNGDKFMRLYYEGDTSDYGGDESAADMALCGQLRFWCRADAAQIDRIFRSSALMRPKWDERHGEDTYGNITIRNAVAASGQTYGGTREGEKAQGGGFGESVPPNNTNSVTLREVQHETDDTESYRTEHSYNVKNGHLTRTTMNVGRTKDEHGQVIEIREPEIPLSNFNAWIVRAVVVKGDEEKHMLDIAGERDDGELLPEIRIDADEFASMKWLALWNGRAIQHAGVGTKDHLRAAIQFLSVERGYPTKTVYSNIGWVMMNTWKYLHAGGAIDANGLDQDVEVDGLLDNLKLYNLPSPPTADKLRKDVQKVVSLLDASYKEKEIAVRFPFLDVAKTFRAPLNEVLPIVTSTFLLGRTGRRKTPYNAVWQGFYGSEFSEHALPANWSSTGNANEKMLYLCKDAVCEMDDYRPVGDRRQLGAYGLKGEQVLRGQANKQGRGRMNADRSMAQTYYSRAMLSISGEDLPPGESLLARTMIRNVSDTDITPTWLTKAQRYVQEGVGARVMAAFLMWLAPQIDALKESKELDELRKRKRDEYTRKLPHVEHKRVYTAMADFYVGFEILMRFMVNSAAIVQEKADELRDVFEQAILEVGTEQANYIRSARPEEQYLEGIAAILASGRGYLCEARTMFNEHGEQEEVPQAPNEPSALGWMYGKEHVQKSGDGYESTVTYSWIARGKQIGWIETTADGASTIYLEPSAAYAEFHKLMSEQGVTVTNTRNRLYQLLSEKGFAVTDKVGSGSGKQTKIHGRNVRTIHIDAKLILNPTDDEECERTEHAPGNE